MCYSLSREVRVDQSPRLRRYSRKDYTQLVDFPVEIVGRDGQVRRFSFDESVRLYHRRIHSAALRYEEPEMIDAETRHCQQRIEQLRRSYLERYGWASLQQSNGGRILGTPLAAEVAAFLRRAFAERLADVRLLQVIAVDGAPDTCYLQLPDVTHRWFLYAFRLDIPEERAGFRETLSRLANAPIGDGVERLLAAREGPDVGLLLAGTEGEPMLMIEDPSISSVLDESRDLWLEAMRSLYDGRIAQALSRLELGAERQPARRVLTQTAALVCMLDLQADRAEFNARLGSLRHPDDFLLTYLLAVALCRQDRISEALPIIQTLEARHSGHPLTGLLGTLLDLHQGRLFRAWRRLQRLTALSLSNRPAQRALTELHRLLVRGAIAVLAVSGVVTVIAAIYLPVFTPMILGGVFGLGLLSLLLWSKQLARQILLHPRHPRVRLVSPELMPRDRRGETHH